MNYTYSSSSISLSQIIKEFTNVLNKNVDKNKNENFMNENSSLQYEEFIKKIKSLLPCLINNFFNIENGLKKKFFFFLIKKY